MTYNLSPKSVERMLPVLNELLAGKERRISSDQPHALAYRIREAIAAAAHHKISPYHRLQKAFSFTIGNGVVIARPRLKLIKDIEAPIQMEDMAVSEFDVVSVADKSLADEIQFPNFRGDYEAVRRWAKQKGWKIRDDPLTLRRDG